MSKELDIDLLALLNRYWGYEAFRFQQLDIIKSIVTGQDTLAVLPTGAGKSLCYQVPGLYLEGVTLVVSPLIALIKDQINGLKSRKIKAAGIYSGQTKREQDILLDNAIYGDQKFLFVSPERLKTTLFRERFMKMNVGLIAIDEAHCISEWGHDFRPEYRMIAEIRALKPEVPFIAVTATATPQVREDITTSLEFKDYKQFIASPVRPNLSYNILETESKKEVLSAIVSETKEALIIYVNTRKTSRDLERHLTAKGIKCRAYHGGMDRRAREKCIAAWDSGEVRTIIATKAFGMGIDKANVRKVLHYQLPQSLEAYVQEAGRAGRDGKEAHCIILYSKSDKLKLNKLINDNFPSLDYIKDVYKKLCSYLAVASGPSEYEFYPFYLAEFAKKYQLRIITLLSALKFLHQSDIIYLSDAILHPSQLTLSEIQTKKLLSNPKLSDGMREFIKLLLRNYEGLFMDFCVIDEQTIAKKHNTSRDKVKNAISWLHKKGIGEYRPSFDGHTISFMEFRYDSAKLPLKVALYEKRKERMVSSIQSMVKFVEATTCRQEEIAGYFSFEATDCMVCDNCVAKYNNEDTRALQYRIEQHLEKEPISLTVLFSKFEIGLRNRIIEVLSEMESERAITIEMHKIKLLK